MHSPFGSGLGLTMVTLHVPAGPAGAPQVGAGVADGDGDGEGDGEGEGDGDGDGEGEGLGDGDGLAEGEGLGDGLGDGEGCVPRTRTSTSAVTLSVPFRAVSSNRVVAFGWTTLEPFESTLPRPWSIETSSAPETSQLKTLLSPGSTVGGEATKRATANSLGPLSLSR